MERKSASGMMLTLLLVSMLTLTFNIQPAKTDPATIIVPDDYPTIQEAINVANTGDTIFVRVGTYPENVAVNKTVSLIGESKQDTVIVGNPNVVSITVHNVRVSGFLIIGGSDGAGVFIYSANNNTISDCSIVANLVGIAIESSYYNIIANNLIDNNSLAGISLYLSHNNTIIENTISNTTSTRSSIGIAAFQSNNSVIYHNNFVNNLWAPFRYRESVNKWDDGYPSGGNYWSDYNGTDLYNGPYQNLTGSDGIGDVPYTVPYSNDTDNYPLMKPYSLDSHDIGVTYIGRVYFELTFPIVIPLKTIVGIGLILHFNVFVMNYGTQPEVFNITVYANDTIIDTLTNINIASRESIILNFTWDTIGFAKGNYILKAYAWPVPGETNTADNTYLHDIFVATDGDVNNDGIVDIFDIVMIAMGFGSSPPAHPNADLNDDGIIDIFDIVIVAASFGFGIIGP